MKRFVLFIGLLISLSATSQIKFSGFQSKGTLTGAGYIVGYEGANNTRIPFTVITSNTSAAIAAERSATGTYTGKTFSGSNNTFLNIPQSAVTNVAADIAARVTMQQLRDSLNRVDTTRKIQFVNIGGGYGLFESASADTVKALTLVQGSNMSITRVGNTLVFAASSVGGADFGGNNTWTGTNTFNNNVTVNGNLLIGGAPDREYGVPTTPAGGVTRVLFGDRANRTEYTAGNPLDWLSYHGIAIRSDEFASGPAMRATTGNPAQPAGSFRAHATQSTWIYNWTTSANTVLGGVAANGEINFPVREYADNAAALAAGLPLGRPYRTGDLLKIVH